MSLLLLIFLPVMLFSEGAREDSQVQVQSMWQPQRPIELIVPAHESSASAAVADALIPVMENRLKQKIVLRLAPEISAEAIHELPADGYTWIAATSMDRSIRQWASYYVVSIPLLLLENSSPGAEYTLACPAEEMESGKKVLALKQSGRLLTMPGSYTAIAALLQGKCSAALARSTDAVSFLRSGRIDSARVLDSQPLKLTQTEKIYPLQLINSTVIMKNPFVGIFLPPGTPEEVLNTLDSIWDHEIKNSRELVRWAADRGFAFRAEESRRNNE